MFQTVIYYRGFMPHESGPSYVNRREHETREEAEQYLQDFFDLTEIAVLKWELYELKLVGNG